ncbi:hypothetical protein HDV00_011125 [Rhizophlyctis rosea]|nr:hypothetical protein HDV00_011125 [Rhizophlyctis rosea]
MIPICPSLIHAFRNTAPRSFRLPARRLHNPNPATPTTTGVLPPKRHKRKPKPPNIAAAPEPNIAAAFKPRNENKTRRKPAEVDNRPIIRRRPIEKPESKAISDRASMYHTLETRKLWETFEKQGWNMYGLNTRDCNALLRYIRGDVFNKTPGSRTATISNWASRIQTAMRFVGARPIAETYWELLQCKVGDLPGTQQLLEELTAANFDPNDPRVLQPLLKTYAMAGQFDLADQTYQKLLAHSDGHVGRDQAAATLYIQGLSRGKHMTRLHQFIEDYRASGKELDEVLYEYILRAYISEKNIPAIFVTIKEMRSKLMMVKKIDYMKAVEACLSTGDVASAWQALHIMKKEDRWSNLQHQNLAIHIYAMEGNAFGAWSEYGKFSEGLAVETRSLKALGMVTLKHLGEGRSVPEDILRDVGIPISVELYRRLLLMYRLNAREVPGGTGSMGEAILKRMMEQGVANASDFGLVISAYGQVGDMKKVKELVKVMRKRGLQLEGRVYASLLSVNYVRGMGDVNASGVLEVLGMLREEGEINELKPKVLETLTRLCGDRHPLHSAVQEVTESPLPGGVK